MTKRTLLWAVIILAVIGIAGAVWYGQRVDEERTILVILPTVGNPFWVDVKVGAEDGATAIAAEFETLVRAGDEDAAADRQKELLGAFMMNKSIAAVVVGPASSSAIVPEVRDYQARGIPVVVIDSRLSEEGLASSFIGSNNVAGGKMAAQAMAQELNGTDATVLLIGGSMEHQTARDRASGFKSGVPASWSIREEIGEWNRTRAREIMEAAAGQSMPDGVFAASDEMAMGAIEGLRGLGVEASEWPVIIGFDATEEGLRAIDDGLMRATVKQRAFEMGREGVLLAAAYARGEPGLPKEKLLDVELVRR